MSTEALVPASADAPIWRRSSYSGGQGDCLELAHSIPALAPVRDSKRPAGPVIPFSRNAWRSFIVHIV
ncbi:DUF397 domain-containing protein [Streptomyces dysideae]|uniref:DUF397 domain-containing protein n=1 Tax=Streptomyces dysideae TaxID=909626 RepID=A0A101V226_9ACTN|nr:DUF397 domain-containing protein [Streptomyces dysideae]KUO21058.1 hypothetical protein AQJ91_10460 [Streptomyces dysideae]